MAKRLVAVRPNSTIDFEYEGVTFEIGIVPQHVYSKWVTIGQKMLNKKQAIDGDELFSVQSEIVKWGVKGHKDFCFEDGEEVPFQQKKVTIGNKTHMVVSDETMEIYYSSKIIQGIYADIINGGKIKDEDESPKEEDDNSIS